MEQFKKVMLELAEKGEQCIHDIDNWYKEFEVWRDCLLDDLERIKTQKNPKAKVVPLVPLTPAASYKKRTRRRLSTVPEIAVEKTNSVKTTNTNADITSSTVDETVCAVEKPRRKAARNARNKITSASNSEEENENVPIRKSKRACVTREKSALRESGEKAATRSRSAKSREGSKVSAKSREASKVSAKSRETPEVSTESQEAPEVSAKSREAPKVSSKRSSIRKNEEVLAVSIEEHTSLRVSKEDKSMEEKGESLDKTVRGSANKRKAEASLNKKNEETQAGKLSAVENIETCDRDCATEEIEKKLSDEVLKSESDKKTSESCNKVSLNKGKEVKKSIRIVCTRLSHSRKPSRKVSKARQSSQRITRQTLKKLSQASSKKSGEKLQGSSREPTGHTEENKQIEEMTTDENLNAEEKIQEEADETEEMETNVSDDESNYCSADEGNSKINHVHVEITTSDEVEEASKQLVSTPAEVSGKNFTFAKTANTKSPALFSPYANEPVKNRVAAYETLHSVPEEPEKDAVPVRMTRTKTRALAAPKNEEMQKLGKCADKIKNGVAKENCVPPQPKSVAGMGVKFTPSVPTKILTQNNSLLPHSTAKKTPMPNSALITSLITPSSGQMNKVNNKPGVILSNVHTFIKKKTKAMPDLETQKLEEQKKRQEKEKKAQRRKEEFLRKKADDQKKWDEKRMKVLQNREAKEREKHESQLRLEKEKTEKMNILLQQREAKQKEELLQKKIEAERKAAEARRKHEEAEAARIAKLKLQEEQNRKEQEENEMQRQGVKRAAEEKETAVKREKLEPPATSALTIHVDTHQMPPKENLNTTFTKSNSNPKNNVYKLNEIDTDESSGDETSHSKNCASWASKHRLLHKTELELDLHELAERFFACPKGPMDLRKIFNSHVKRDYKRTSSAIWHTPPRYSQLPKY